MAFRSCCSSSLLDRSQPNMTSGHIPAISYPVILLAVFARQMCLPVPAVLFLVTAGALAESGKLNFLTIVMLGVVGCLFADLAWFEAGRRWGSRMLRLLCTFSADRRYCAKRARDVFSRWGLRSLLVAKFIPGLDGLMPPLSGMNGVGVLQFVLFDTVGALLWSGAYCFAGYVFASRLEKVSGMLNQVSGLLVVVVTAPLVGYLLWRAWELFRMMRQLRIRTITPVLLQQKLASGEKIALLDLLLFEGEEQEGRTGGIPGAVRIDPARLRSSTAKVRVPRDVKIVLYCSSLNEITSARVAVSLRHKGISKVWVLEGGLKAWRELNFPVTTELGSPEEIASRFGIEVIERSHNHAFSLT